MFIHSSNFFYREISRRCQTSNIAPLWQLESTERKVPVNISSGRMEMYGDVRTLTYETEDKSMKNIQNVALYVLAFNCGIIAYWLREFKPIFNDFLTNHGAKNANGQRIGQPRTQISIFGLDKNIGLNRFIILVKFLSKILVPFVDSITGKFNQQNI